MNECVRTVQITSSGIWKHLPSSLGAVVPSPVLLPQRRAAAETPRCPRGSSLLGRPCRSRRSGCDEHQRRHFQAQPPPPLRCGAERAQRRRAPPSSAGRVGGQGRRGGRGSTRDPPVCADVSPFTWARLQDRKSGLRGWSVQGAFCRLRGDFQGRRAPWPGSPGSSRPGS